MYGYYVLMWYSIFMLYEFFVYYVKVVEYEIYRDKLVGGILIFNNDIVGWNMKNILLICDVWWFF